MMTIETRVQDLVEKLRSQDCRITPQRLAILHTLAASHNHPSVEQIFEKVKGDFPTTSIATVYKTISLLKGMGELIEFSFGDGSNHYDGRDPSPHPHFICQICRCIEDIEIPELARIGEQLAGHSDYLITAFHINAWGICPACQAVAEKKKA
ncbi:MAG: transcriptional repressor [Desulfuromonadaceae bacterium]|nr:transcriptional repressor [Desulfuromonadaceae bacterium]